MRSNLPINKKECGFTLIETMVVAAIMAILAGIAIPAFIQWMPNYTLKSAAQDLYSDLQSAKMEAVKTNADISINFNANGYTKWDGNTVTFSDYGYEIGYGEGNATAGIDGENFGNHITYSTPDDVASFNSRGMMNNTGNSGKGFIYLENKRDTAYAIGSRLSGVIELRKWNESSNSWE